MEHKGLVSRVTEHLERGIALGQWPQGILASERMLAKHYGVSRTTIRGALQGLAARGLIVQHPGRQSRAVALGEALSLESLKLLLPESRNNEDRRRLLEGYFALKREVIVELLAACCEHARQDQLDLLKDASFALREAARWQEERRGWVQHEFDLLRWAARAVDRPGHSLLVLSLEKAFWGLADCVLPALKTEPLQQWALFVFNALVDRDAQALRRELPALLKAVDEPLLEHLVPGSEAHTPPETSPVKEPLLGQSSANWYDCHTSSQQVPPTEELAPQAVPDSGSTPAHNSPADPLSSCEPLGGSCSPGTAPTPTRRVSSSMAPAGGPGAPPTLLADLALPSSSEALSLVARLDKGDAPNESRAALSVDVWGTPRSEEQTGPRHGGTPEGTGSLASPRVRES